MPRVYRTVERLNVRYLSCEEVNIGGNDQECGVYKEGYIMRKIKEDGEKIGVKVIRVKVARVIRGERGKGEVERREGRRKRGRGKMGKRMEVEK